MKERNDFLAMLGLPGWSVPFSTLADPSKPWPSPSEVDGTIVQLEQQLRAERGEAAE